MMQMYFHALKVFLKKLLDRLIASSNLSLNYNFGSTLAHLSQAATLKFNLKTSQLNQEAAAQAIAEKQKVRPMGGETPGVLGFCEYIANTDKGFAGERKYIFWVQVLGKVLETIVKSTIGVDDSKNSFIHVMLCITYK